MKEVKFRALVKPLNTKQHWEYYKTLYAPTWLDYCKIIVRDLQFTGLLDKHGKEIYEGDIVSFDNSEIGGQDYIGEVIWNSDNTLSELEWGLWTIKGYLKTDFLGTIEILGNKFESPELLS